MDPRTKWWVSLFWHRINDTLTPENGDTESDWSVHLDEEQCTSKQAYFFRAGENFVAILPVSPVSVYSLWLSVSFKMQAHWLKPRTDVITPYQRHFTATACYCKLIVDLYLSAVFRVIYCRVLIHDCLLHLYDSRYKWRHFTFSVTWLYLHRDRTDC